MRLATVTAVMACMVAASYADAPAPVVPVSTATCISGVDNNGANINKAAGRYRNADTASCKKWYQCDGAGGLVRHGMCSSTTWFHDDSGDCGDGRPNTCSADNVIPEGHYGYVCYGRQTFTKTACLSSAQTVSLLGLNKVPTAVFAEVIGAGLPATPVVSGYTAANLAFTSFIANKQITSGNYLVEYALIQDTGVQGGSLRTDKFQYGAVQITNFETLQKCVSVNFVQTMAGVPAVKLSVHTGSPEELIYLWAADVTTTGFKACYHEGILFSGLHAFAIHYVAVAKDGQVEGQRDIQLENGRAQLLTGSSAPIGTMKFCTSVTFDLTYMSQPYVFVTAETKDTVKHSQWISYVAAINRQGATICARNSEDAATGVRAADVVINYIVMGGRIDIVPGMVILEPVAQAPTVFCRDVAFPANKFYQSLAMHVQLTVTWQKHPVLANDGSHEAAAVWAESLTHGSFKACALVAGRHFAAGSYPIPAVNWLAYQLPASQCVTPPLIGGICNLPDWYTGARCCSVNVGKPIAAGSKIHVSVRHTRLQTWIDAMTSWSEINNCGAATTLRLCARELQNFDGLHSGIVLHWLLIEAPIAPFIPEHGDVGFPRQFYGVGGLMPAVCKVLNFNQDYTNLPIATVILSPKNYTANNCNGCQGFSTNDFVTWIETRNQKTMRICMKSIRACLYREDTTITYTVVTEPRCAGKTTGFYLKDNFCKEYHQCNDGAYSEGACATDQYFNLDTGKCQAAVPNGCQDPRCIGEQNGFYLINTKCQSYYQCNNGFYSQFNCQGGQYFNKVSGQCQATVPTGCEDPRCNNKNGFYLINNFCKNYYQCTNGFYTANQCATGYFNIVSGQCQATVPNGCQDPRCIGQADGFYVVNNFCRGYFQCAQGIYTLGACGNGEYFNVLTKTCQTTAPATCKDPRCIGIADGWNIINTQCRAYYRCAGEFYTGFTCNNAAAPYFNLASGQCENAVPQGCQDPRCGANSNGWHHVNNLCQQYYRCQDGFYTGGQCNTNQFFDLTQGQCGNTLPNGCQDPRCTTRQNGFYRIDNFCRSYFRCADGFYTQNTCDAGKYFHTDTNTCATTLPIGCRDPRCTNQADGFYLLDNSCRGYFECKSGFYSGFGCPNTQYYNIALKACQNDVPQGCQDPRCNQGDGTFILNNLCQGYYTCAGGFYQGGVCATGTYYNVQQRVCSTTLPNNCQDPRCSGRNNGRYLLNNLCTRMFICTDGFYKEENCPNGLYFNQQTSTTTSFCQSTLPADCQDPKCIGQADRGYVINDACLTFYTCLSGFATAGSCQIGQYYSNAQQQCVTDLPAGCRDPKCNGLNGNYRIQTDSLCRSFFTCSLQGVYSINTCQTGTYFHSDTRSCQSAVPAGCADPQCNGISDGTYVLNNLCTASFRCQGGQYTRTNCPTGTYFNTQTFQCQNLVPSGCQDPRCVGQGDGFYVTNNLCTSYFQCAAGLLSSFQCNPGQYYNIQTRQCQATTPSGCQSPLCIGRQNGLHVTNNLCMSYFRCTAGMAEQFNCPTNTYFNAANGNCEAGTPQGCQDSFCQIQTDGNYPIDSVCRTYYTCANGFKSLNTCPNGGFYNSITRQCQVNVPNGCKHPDCATRQNGNYVVDTTCKGFFTCTNGLKSSAECTQGLYFNEAIGICQPTIPTGCANPLCVNKADGSYIVNDLCNRYYTCLNGAYAIQSCGNQYFNSLTQSCQNTVPNGCQNPLCIGRGDGSFLSNNLCTSYFVCTGNSAVVNNCPVNTYFNEATKQCQNGVPQGCQDPICSSRNNGVYISDGNVCKAYFTCLNGFRTPGTCTNGYMNVNTQACQTVAPVGCQPASQCSGRADGTYRLSSDLTCSSYFRCTGNAIQSFQCSGATPYFHTDTMNCQAAQPVGCQAIVVVNNPCAGVADNTAVRVDQFCNQYFFCINQQRQATLSCPTNTHIFTTGAQAGQCASGVPQDCFHPECYTTNTQSGLVQYKANGNYVIGATCTGGFRCTQGIYTNAVTCGNQYFNTFSGQCQATIPTGCATRTVNICANRQNNYYLTTSDQNRCQSFYQCNNQQLIGPFSQSCTAGQYINTQLGTCVTTPPTGCIHPNCYTVNNGVFSNFKQNGGYTTDQTCLSGYVCTNGFISQVSTCSTLPRTYYHSDTGTCSSVKPVNCIG